MHALKGNIKAVVGVLVVLGAYFLLFHAPPWPLSHESLGLTDHFVHNIVGVVLLAGAGLLWWKNK